jgi:pantoate--beta-alanine ligase
MEHLRDKARMRAWSHQQHRHGHRIGLVPTMGYLHDGHLSLVRAAQELTDCVVVSIYVNPTQFAPHEDFATYPRDEAGDLAKLEGLGVDAAFLPTDLYDGVPAPSTWIDLPEMARPLCGKSRPHFFRGVATVVAKLLHLVEPDVAVFGKKDYQQWRVIETMVRELDFPVRVIGRPTVREPDGLAMSSRNARLDPQSRDRARSIYQGLCQAHTSILEGAKEAATLIGRVASSIQGAGGSVDYAELVDAVTLAPLASLDRPALLAVAATFGGIRLIDNLEPTPPVNQTIIRFPP